MTTCTDERLASMLYAFELNLLDESDRRETAIHLYACDHCFQRARDFERAARLLAHDPEVRAALARDAATASQAESDQKSTHIGHRRWTFARYLLAAALVLAIGVPLYHVLVTPGTHIQRIELTPVRGGPVPTLFLEADGIADIRFSIESVRGGGVYRVLVFAVDGDTLLSDRNFMAIEPEGYAHVEIPLDAFRPGYYMLTVEDPTGEFLDAPVAYLFSAQ